MSLSFLIISLLLFFLGAAIGSFLNVVIHRTLHDESWVKGRSKCESCHKQIKWYDNIPLLSYLILRAKCRFCKAPIALTHPVVEFLVGSLFVWWYWGGTFFFHLTQHPFVVLQPLFWLLVGLVLVLIFVTDYLYLIIPDSFVAALLGLTLLYRIALVWAGIMKPVDFGLALLGMILTTGFIWSLWKFTKGKGMGFGDVKLMIPLSLLLGWPKVFVAVFFSFVVGAMAGVILLSSKKKKFGQVIPFGPFLVIGTVISLLWGELILSWYLGLL